MQTLCDNINLLGTYCGVRDIADLTPACLREKLGVPQADAMVLFGGSILAGGDLLARAMKEKVADKYIIVGGEGHTTQTLRDVVHAEIPSLETDGLPEAEIFDLYLQSVYGLKADYLECRSTNCGNNITNLLALVEREHIPFSSVILAQDATMMRRMDAVLRSERTSSSITAFTGSHRPRHSTHSRT